MNTYVVYLAELEGYHDPYKWLGALMADEDFLSNGICTACKMDAKVEPDCVNGTCQECGAKAVNHAFVLAGIL